MNSKSLAVDRYYKQIFGFMGRVDNLADVKRFDSSADASSVSLSSALMSKNAPDPEFLYA